MEEKQLKPLGGFVLIKPVEKSKTNGPLILPQISRGRFRNFMGQVIAVGIKGEYEEYCIFQNSRFRRFRAIGINKDLEALRDKFVFCETGVAFDVKLSDGTTQTFYRVHFKDVAGIIEDPQVDKIEAIDTGMRRCPRCKSTGARNILLDGSGYCPRCGLDADGNIKPKAKRLSRKEEETYGTRYMKERRLQQLGDRRPKERPDRIMTFGKGH